MPKPMLKPQTQVQADSVLSLTQNREAKQGLTQADEMKLDRLLRKPRSRAYMNAIAHLDAGGHTHNAQLIKEITDSIRQEFPEVELGGVMLGIVSKCYLGENYEVHSLDISGTIIEHFRQGQMLPGGMEKARSIAIRGGYEFIEVYVDCCRAISSNGSVSVIK
jgi:hypothetical protein